MNEIAFGNATMFRYACDTLVDKMNQGFSESGSAVWQEEAKLKQSLVVPVIVNASFACELFLKSLLPSIRMVMNSTNCFPNLIKTCKMKL